MVYMVMAKDGMKIKACRSFNDAKLTKRLNKGSKIVGYSERKLPKSVMIRFGDSKYAKREILREVYAENPGYHLERRYNNGTR